MSARLRATSALIALTLAASGLTACSTTDEQAPATQAEWPRTVHVGEDDVTVNAEPHRVVTLSTETADLALELVGPDRVVAVPSSATDPTAGNQSDLASQVETTLAPGVNPDPEQILSLDPDLVIVTGRHDGEQSVADLLTDSGVPTATFTSADFSSPERVGASVTAMGELLGADEKARELTDALADETARVTDAVSGVSDRPTALVLFQRGGSTMIQSASSATPTLVELAGGTSLAATEGMRQAAPADPETIVRLNPEVIFVQDFHGSGRASYDELLTNPALASVPAIADDRVVTVDALTTSGTAGVRLGEGLRQIAEALHPEVF